MPKLLLHKLWPQWESVMYPWSYFEGKLYSAVMDQLSKAQNNDQKFIHHTEPRGGLFHSNRLEVFSAWFEIEMEQTNNKGKTLFVCTLGFWELKRMLQGITNAASTFQRLIKQCIGDINREKERQRHVILIPQAGKGTSRWLTKGERNLANTSMMQNLPM